MKIKILGVIVFFSFGLILTTGGPGGCGGGSGEDDAEEGTSADLTEAEQTDCADAVMAQAMVDSSLFNGLGDSGAGLQSSLVKRQDAGCVIFNDMGEGNLCSTGGSAQVCSAGLGSSYSGIDFTECSNMYDNGAGGTYIVLTGSITVSSTTVTYGGGTYDNLRMRIVTDTIDRTCTATGSAVRTSASELCVSTDYNLTETCNSGTTFTHTGEVDGCLLNSHFILNGSAVYTITGASSGRIARCTYTDFDVTTATCADFVTACGLSASTCD